MALKIVSDLTALTAPDNTDLIPVFDASVGSLKKSTITQVVAVSDAALKAGANTFTAAQAITPSATGTVGLTITPPASNGAVTALNLAPFNNGTDIGNRLSLGENNNGSTPAAGHINFRTNASASRYVWCDATGVLRVHTSPPSSAGGISDTAGTVIGAQTSHAAYKDVLGAPVADDVALASLVAAAADVRRFIYKDGVEEFSGIVLDGPQKQRYGTDPDEEHAAGRALNVINAIGDIMLALRAIERRLAALEAA